VLSRSPVVGLDDHAMKILGRITKEVSVDRERLGKFIFHFQSS
jgi:hypothetical protein